MKSKILILVVIFLAACSTPRKTIKNDEILWDKYGVPHIYATSDRSLFFMSGWSQMRNHGNMMLKLYGEARGTSAELWGEGFEINKTLHLLGIYDQMESTFRRLDPKYQAILKAFTDGVNTYAQKHRDQLNEKYLKVLPVSEYDILAHIFRCVNYEFLIRQDFVYTQRLQAGSNAWALAGSKTASGNAMLVANPHLPWAEPYLWFEQQFITNEFNMYGVSFLGMPSMTLGFNDYISWTHTVNTLDNTDLFEVKKVENRYLLDGEYLPFEESSYNVKVLKEDGTTETREFIRKKTKHGIVIREFDDKVISIRFAQMDDFMPCIEQYDLMVKSRNLDDFIAALSLRQMPFLNTLYADREGNIMYHFGGLVPKKNGDWDKWQGLVSGDSSEEIWTEYYRSDELPKTVNPPSGWLQNANDPPYTNTIPAVLNPADFASHIAPLHMEFRPQRSARLISEENNITFERLIELKHDNKAELALRLHDDLLELKEMTSDSLVLAAIETLTRWDGSYDSESLGSVLFIEFIRTIAAEKKIGLYQVGGYLKDKWNFTDPIKTPDGFADKQEIIDLIGKAAKNHLSKYPALEVPYGHYYRLKAGNLDFPATGGPQHLGVFRIVISRPFEKNRFAGYFGDTFVLVVEMGKTIKAKGLLTYGNSSNPESKYYWDQLELFSKNQLRDIWATRTDQENNLDFRESIKDM
jgi:acyl-homoserine-lactone acylase